MPVEWTSDLNTGIEPIDQQHRKFVDCINELEVAIRQKDSGAVGRVLDGVAAYCLSLFPFEEDFQEKVGYKFAKSHKSVHDIFVKRLAKYRDRHRAGEDVAQQLLEILTTWLMLHIKREDKNFVPDALLGTSGRTKGESGEDWLSRSVAGFFGSNR